MSDYWGHDDWEADYPGGYECCASGSCEVCRGAQGFARIAAAAVASAALVEDVPTEERRSE